MRLALIAALVLMPLYVRAEIVCDISGCKDTELTVDPFSTNQSFSVQQVWGIVNDILNVSGLVPNFQVLETRKVDNAAAVVVDEQRLLAFNPDWLNTYKDSPGEKWTLYGVMAHEVGHHLQGHTLTKVGSRPPTELEADEYAGFVLAALGATVPDAQTIWRTFSEAGSPTHPPRRQRLEAVERGWLRYSARQNNTPAAAPARPDISRGPAPVAAPSAPVLAPAIERRPSIPSEICTQVQTGLGPARACASSRLGSNSKASYGVENLFDGTAQTAWVENVPGPGQGQFLTFEFARPVTLSWFRILNGYGKSTRLWNVNGRLVRMGLSASNGQRISVSLIDQADWQSLGVSGFANITWLALTLDQVKSGDEYNDTAISEFEIR